MISEKGEGCRPFSNFWTARRGGGVGHFLFLTDRRGGGVHTPPVILSDISLEQPLSFEFLFTVLFFVN